MGKMALNREFGLYEKKGEPMCSSRQVAETFGKNHQHVLRDIRGIIDNAPDLTVQFWTANFIEDSYTSRGKKYPEFFMTHDGFTFLVMGYSGARADEFKIMYIQRFNQMKGFIKTLIKARLEHPAFTKAIEEVHDDPQSYHYSNEADMINRIVLGMSAKKFREEVGLKKGESIRPYLTQPQIDLVEELQRIDIGLLSIGMQYEDRKAKLTAFAQKRVLQTQLKAKN